MHELKKEIVSINSIEHEFGYEERKTEFDDEKSEDHLIKLFEQVQKEELMAGRPYYLDYSDALILIADIWKENVGGLPQGTFLLAFYEEEDEFVEALLLRVIKPIKLPAEEDVIRAIIDYYKDNKETSGSKTDMDAVTRHELSYSGIKCRILGTFYRHDGKMIFGSDVENFYSSYHYKAYKLRGKALEYIINSGVKDFKIGKVRYSSSEKFRKFDDEVPVFINPEDFLGQRTALFGMTRTGKSNTVKKIIEATSDVSKNYTFNSNENNLMDSRKPKLPIGQIIFDINGEYANKNRQDKGTAIFEMFDIDMVERWSFISKKGFKVMKTNFYADIEEGFNHIQQHFYADERQFVTKFLSVNLSKPDENSKSDGNYRSELTRYDRRVAAYRCCLKLAGFELPDNYKTLYFQGRSEINEMVNSEINDDLDPSKGINIDDAIKWFSIVWKNYNDQFFKDYEDKKKKPWADKGLQNLLIFLTKKNKPKKDGVSDKEYSSGQNHGGYDILTPLIKYHTPTTDNPYQEEIINALRNGKIVIVDLSEGDPEVQEKYSEKICRKIFQDSIKNFGKNLMNNFIQFYFEEAHNLFPKKEDKDLSQIYNRLAKEGAKLNLGIIYATQEVSSISSNILKNTQNWFISHLNNNDELKELEKYYDFEDFIKNLKRFSPNLDKGFVRMKLYSNPFVVPVQIDEFKVEINNNAESED